MSKAKSAVSKELKALNTRVGYVQGAVYNENIRGHQFGSRAIDVEQRTVRLSMRELNDDVTCPICLGVIRQTKTFKQCLHRFCAACIEKYLRTGKHNECPQCRKHCASRRSLHEDKAFDALINALYPDRAVLDKHDVDLARTVSNTESARKISANINKNLEKQTVARRLHAGKRSDVDVASNSKLAAKASSSKQPPKPVARAKSALHSNKSAQPARAIEICLIPTSDKGPALVRKNFRTLTTLTIRGLRCFILSKLNQCVHGPRLAKVTILKNGASDVIPGDLTLGQLAAVWAPGNSITLLYSVTPVESS